MLEHDHILPAIFNPTCVLDRNEVDAYREERKRQKKLHKEREREREHKKKHKCYDDTCKHRKHKKRRKHKKHHHKDEVEERALPVIEDNISPDESVSQTGDNVVAVLAANAEEHEVEKCATKEDTEEEAGSTVTESSGSIYVSLF